MGVRVLKEGKVGFAYSTEEEVDVIYRAMENLIPDRYTSIPEPSKDMPDPKGIFHREVLDIGEEDLLEDLNTMRDILKEGGITVTGGAVERSYLYNRVLNSKGLDVEEEFTYYSASISGIKEDIIHESADLIYHLFVLLAYSGVEYQELIQEFIRRRKKSKF
ncbi:MAG TPA: hypothetical protein EYP47_04765 [Methanococcaceae archaeon]|nr:hypothetical protein [Methanococcaceae archaeon]